MVKALPLVVALLLSTTPGKAGDPAPVQSSDEKASPELLRLEKNLTDKQTEKKDGRLPPEQYQEWERAFRSKLEDSFARVPPAPENTAAHARITALLDGREQASKALDQALESNPDSPVLLRTKSQLLYEQKDYAGAAQYSLQAWEKSGRTDQSALALYQMTKGRSAHSGATTSPPPSSGPSPVAATSPQKTASPSAATPHPQTTDVPVPGQSSSDPSPSKGKSPKWPLTVPIAMGMIGYGLYRAKQNDAGGDSPAEEPKTASMPAAVLGVASGPAAEAAKKVMAEAVANAAKAAAARVVVATAITGATFVAIAGAGVATIYGLDRMIEAQDKYNESIDTHRDLQNRPAPVGQSKNNPVAGAPPNQEQVWVVRGGIAIPKQLKEGVDEHPRVRGLAGFSVQSAAGKSIEELAAAGEFRHGQISVTTVSELLAVGVPVVKSPGNGYHNTAKTEDPLTDSHALAISSVFKARPNPARVKK